MKEKDAHRSSDPAGPEVVDGSWDKQKPLESEENNAVDFASSSPASSTTTTPPKRKSRATWFSPRPGWWITTSPTSTTATKTSGVGVKAEKNASGPTTDIHPNFSPTSTRTAKTTATTKATATKTKEMSTKTKDASTTTANANALVNPLSQANAFSVASTWWMGALISRGGRRPLDASDVPPLCPEDRADALVQRFQVHWAAELLAAASSSAPDAETEAELAPTAIAPTAIASKGKPRKQNQRRKQKCPSLLRAVLRTVRFHLFSGLLLLMVSMALTIAQPFFIKAMLDFLQDDSLDRNARDGYLLGIGLTLVSFASVTCLNAGLHHETRVGVNARSIIMDAVFAKTLKLSLASRQQTSSGEVITLLSVDAERMFDAFLLGLFTFIAPLTMVVSIVLVGTELGIESGAVGCAVMLLFLYTTFMVARKIGSTRSKLVQVTEERITVTREVLHGVRVIKLYGWEKAMIEKIAEIRAREMALMRKFHLLRVVNIVLQFAMPVVLGAMCFGIYVALGNKLTVAKAFTVLAFFNVTRIPAAMLPNAIAYLVEGMAGLNRVQRYIQLEDNRSNRQLNNDSPEFQRDATFVGIRDGLFYWEQPPVSIPKEEDVSITFSKRALFALRNINIQFKPNTLTMIVGAVGSGKTSLIHAILGEMKLGNGTSWTSSQIRYVAQEPWIQNTTIRENILFSLPFHRNKYAQVLERTQLVADLMQMEHRDETEIGEQGINLSGGQKARLNLARGLYHCGFSPSEAELLILDDPLSALDIHVANAIFKECILSTIQQNPLLTSILVLNSHYHFLQHASNIIVVSNGEIAATGTYAEIIAKYPTYESREVKDTEEACTSPCEAIPTKMKGNVQAETMPRALLSNDSIDLSENPSDSMTGIDTGPKTNPGAGLISKEDRAVGSVRLSTYTRYFQACGWNGHAILFSILSSFAIGQFAHSFTDYLLGEWAERQEAGANVAKYTRWYLILAGITIFILAVRSVVFIAISIRSSKYMHNRIFARILQAPIHSFFDVTPVGRVLNRFSRDLDGIDTSLPIFFMQALQYLFQVAAVLIVCLLASPWILLTYMPLIICFIALQRFFSKTSRELKRLDGITRTPILNLLSEVMNGLVTLRAFQKGDVFRKLNQQNIDNNARFFFGYWMAGRWLSMRLDWVSVSILFIISIFVVVTKGSIDVAISGLALVYATQLTNFLQRTVRVINALENNMTSVERFLYYETIELEESNNRIDMEKVVEGKSTDKNIWPTKGGLVVKDASMRYRSGLPLILKNISFAVQPKEKIGICGRTGSGKSSLMAILFRTIELESGSVQIDGKDIATVSLHALRSSLAIIPQDPVLFSGSLRFNLDPSMKSTDAGLWDILRKVHLCDEVTQWEGGLDFQVTEKGSNLSLGQRQLICIGRALLRKCSIVVLDEATANVDLETDKLIQRTIAEGFVNQTLLCIAHRLETIMGSDKILVLSNGHVVEFDAPQVLLQKQDGVFKSLVDHAAMVNNPSSS